PKLPSIEAGVRIGQGQCRCGCLHYAERRKGGIFVIGALASGAGAVALSLFNRVVPEPTFTGYIRTRRSYRLFDNDLGDESFGPFLCESVQLSYPLAASPCLP